MNTIGYTLTYIHTYKKEQWIKRYKRYCTVVGHVT